MKSNFPIIIPIILSIFLILIEVVNVIGNGSPFNLLITGGLIVALWVLYAVDLNLHNIIKKVLAEDK